MSNELRDTMATATGNFAAYTEQDLREAIENLSEKFHAIYQAEAKRQGDIRHKDAYADLPENIKEFDRVLARFVLAEFSRIRSEARAGMREACADAASQDAQAILTSVGNIQDTDAGDEIDEDLNRIEKCSLRVASRIRSLPDLAADEAIERIKAKAMFHEHVTTCKECFYLGESLQTPCARRLQLEQRIAALTAAAKESK